MDESVQQYVIALSDHFFSLFLDVKNQGLNFSWGSSFEASLTLFVRHHVSENKVAGKNTEQLLKTPAYSTQLNEFISKVWISLRDQYIAKHEALPFRVFTEEEVVQELLTRTPLWLDQLSAPQQTVHGCTSAAMTAMQDALDRHVPKINHSRLADHLSPALQDIVFKYAALKKLK